MTAEDAYRQGLAAFAVGTQLRKLIDLRHGPAPDWTDLAWVAGWCDGLRADIINRREEDMT